MLLSILNDIETNTLIRTVLFEKAHIIVKTSNGAKYIVRKFKDEKEYNKMFGDKRYEHSDLYLVLNERTLSPTRYAVFKENCKIIK
jgi:hypothetical protein